MGFKLSDLFRSQPKEVAQAIRESDIPQGTPPQEDYKDLPVSTLGNWNVQTVRDALSGHQMGNFSKAALLTESMLGDGRVQSALNGRLKGITMRHAHAKAHAKDKGGKYADLSLKMWARVFHDELLDQLVMWAVIMGFCLCEVCWEEEELDGETVWIPHLKPWHPLYIWYDIVRRQYVAITEEGNVYIDPHDPKWWLFTPWGDYRGWLRGALRSCAPLWIVRQYAMRDWARFSEVHGLPIRKVIAPAQSNAADKTRMFSQVQSLGAASTVLLPQQTGPDGTGWELELLEATDRSWEAFPGLIEQCDREIQQVIRGTNLTSEVQGGSYAAAQVHADEDSGYAESDCRKLCDSAERLIQMFLGYNYGASNVAPTMRLEAPDKADILQLAQTQQFVMDWVAKAKMNGWELDDAKVADRFSIPLVGVNKESAGVTIPLAPTDMAKTVRADEARRSIGLPPMGDERGTMLISELENTTYTEEVEEDPDAPDA